MTKRKKHIHRYHKVNGVWACSLSDCTHYMPLNVEEQVPGKRSLCWNCGQEFIMDDETMKLDRPNCHSCLGIVDDYSDIVEKRLKDLGLKE